MANSTLPQGVLNRLATTLSFPNSPNLRVIPAYLAEGSIQISWDGPATQRYRMLTGIVQSPVPYQVALLRVHLNKANGLAQLWENKRVRNSLLGEGFLYTDAPAGLSPYTLTNCAIENVDGLDFSGTNPVYTVSIYGTYYINASLST